eukprot:TRINITY_DN1412_c0_g1_i5.p1 TRINITY_DN1412_c0_g1~~TRINITY_DN1412_c0_g1_i5.p1  ORF type:complete len:590 (+),score=85.45 TRINITY_DN1412_c0_g1_i5:72-1841(+)
MNSCSFDILFTQAQEQQERTGNVTLELGERLDCCKRKLGNQGLEQPFKKVKHMDPSELEATMTEFHESVDFADPPQVEQMVCESPLSMSVQDTALLEITLGQELCRISNSLLSPFLSETTALIGEFNKKYHLQGSKMECNNDCGSPLLIKHLLETLRSPEVRSSHEPGAVTFKSESCFFMGLLARNEYSREIIIDAGGLDFILGQTKDPSSTIITLRYCCYAIGNLATSLSDDDSGTFYQYIVDEGLIPFLFDTLQKNPDNWQFAQQVFFATGNIAFVCDFEHVLLECDSVVIAIEWLTHHVESAHLCTDAIFFLKNMAYGELGREEILSGGGIKATLNALWRHPTHAELAELAMNLFFDLSFSGALEELTNEAVALRYLMSILDIHRSSISALKECVRTLARIYANSSESIRLFMIKEGFVEKLASVYSEHYYNKTFRRQMESTFCRISREKFPVYVESHPQEERVPSLLELAARTVVDKNVLPQVPQDPSPDSMHVPEDILTLLSCNQRCLICSRTYLKYSRSMVCPARLPAFLCLSPVPYFLSACSESCIEKAKDTSLKLQISNIPTHAVNFASKTKGLDADPEIL